MSNKKALIMIENNTGLGNDLLQPEDTENTPQKVMTSIIEASEKNVTESKRHHGLFRIRTANECLKESSMQPDPIILYDPFLVEGEMTFLFADTGIGKTVFAVQMGTEIAQQQKVLYIDLELSDKQFEKRYRDSDGNLFVFSENFYRLDLTPLLEVPEDTKYTDFFLKSLQKAMKETDAKVVIIDNMTKLAASDTDTAKAAIPLLEMLHKICRLEGVTFLILEHNKKVDNTRPISLNDLQGSKMKTNFADAVFTIGRSFEDNYIRYLKQVKVRSADLTYSTNNVLKCEMTTEGGYLHFEKLDEVPEFSLLKQPTEENRDALIQQAKELKAQGKTQRAIASELGLSVGAVNKYLKK